MSDSRVNSITFYADTLLKHDPNLLMALISCCPNAIELSFNGEICLSKHITLNATIFDGLAFPRIEKLKLTKFETPVFPFLNLVAERVLHTHPGNLKCLSKISLSAYHPDAHHMIGDFLMRFRQISLRVTEFKAVISR